MRRRSIIPFVAVLPFGSIAFAQNWTKPAGGSWGAAPNWSGNALPTDPNFDLGTSGYTVTVGQNFTVDTFTVQTDTVTLNLNFDTFQAAALNISTGAGQVGSLTLLHGEFNATNSATGGTGEVSGGQLIVWDAYLLEEGDTATGAGFNVNGLVVQDDGEVSLQQPGNFSVTNGTFNAGLMNSNASGANLTLNQVMVSNSSYIYSDTLTLGNVTADNSTLSGNTAMSVTGAVTAQDGATVTSPAATVSGSVSVLASAYFTANDLTMTSTGTITVQLNSKVGDPTSQPWSGSNGTLDITFQPGFEPFLGEEFGIFGNTALHPTGTFATLNLPALPSGEVWNTSQLYTAGEISVTPPGVPEPMTFGIMAVTIGGLSLRRKSRS